jgi:uncharacterized protein YcbX
MPIKITQLYIYPVKSLGGIPVSHSLVTDRGLQFDRRWLLVDVYNKFITQREYAQLALFQPEIHNNFLKIVHKLSGDFVVFPIYEYKDKSELVTVWNDTFSAAEVSGEVSRWFSEKLGKEVRLMYQPEESHRSIDSRYSINGEELVSAADGYPVLLVSEASLVELNRRLENEVTALRFRPNIVISGTQAHEEDDIHNFQINTAVFYGVKACSRCILVDREPDTGVVSGKVLKTLSSYRKSENKVLFGQNCVIITPGEIKVGDEVKT